MKKIMKPLDVDIEHVVVDHKYCRHNNTTESTYIYTLRSKKHISQLKSSELFIEEEIPETIKEFKVKHNIDGKQLVEWLNKNYNE